LLLLLTNDYQSINYLLADVSGPERTITNVKA